jgi:hypothetical protein
VNAGHHTTTAAATTATDVSLVVRSLLARRVRGRQLVRLALLLPCQRHVSGTTQVNGLEAVEAAARQH